MGKHNKHAGQPSMIKEAKEALAEVLAEDATLGAEDAVEAVQEPVRKRIGHDTAYAVKDGISHISTLVEFPTDRWGLTKDLKAACIALASRINGSEDKMSLVQETLRVCVGHIQMKYESDLAIKEAGK